MNDPAQTIVNPILYWSDADVWEFHRVEKYHTADYMTKDLKGWGVSCARKLAALK